MVVWNPFLSQTSVPTFQKIFTRNLKMSLFLHNLQQNVHNFPKIAKFLRPYLLPKSWATFEIFTRDNHHMELSLPKVSKSQRPTQLFTLVSRAPKLANFFLKFQKWQISQSHRFYRPHYSNPIFTVQRQFCPAF